MLLQVYLGDEKINDKEILSSAFKNYKLHFDYEPRPYALMIHDMDAPFPSNNLESPFLHYLVVNIHGNDVEKGDVIVPYMAPSPPETSRPHTYVVTLYSQESVVSSAPLMIKRERVDLKEIIAKYNLKFVTKAKFFSVYKQ